MKIAIFTDTYEPEINGIVTSTSNFVRMLADDGYQVIIFCPKYDDKKDRVENNIKIFRFPAFSFATNKNTKIALPYLSKIIKVLKKEKPNLIHIQTPMNLGIAGVIVAKILKIKSIQTYHTYLPEFAAYLKISSLIGIDKAKKKIVESEIAKNIKETSFYQRVRELNHRTKKEYLRLIGNKKIKFNIADRSAWAFTRFLYNKSDLVLTPSKILAKILKKKGIKVPVFDQTNGIVTSKISVKKDYKKTGKIIHFGRLGLEKDVDVIIRAFELAREKDRSLTLHIMGDGPARESLENLVAKRVLTKSVKFYGFVSHDKILKILKDFDLFVTASPMETQGLVILEAMAAGLPVVGVNALAVPEVVIEEKNGYTVSRRNHKKMAEKMLEIISDPKKFKSFGEDSKKIAAEHDIKKAYQRLKGHYYRVTGF
ncbi:MAG: glycosyltransferase [Patescibacteria group bacterium]|nr:glycosyltransferase [Patescibacteria group bacterium]